MNSTIFHLPFTPLEERTNEPAAPVESLGLTGRYGKTRLVALPRDPEWIWLYWEIPPQNSALILRLAFAEGGKIAVETPAGPGSSNYYLKVPVSGETYLAELGVKGAGGAFKSLVKSNPVTVPFGYPADKRPDGFWEIRTRGSGAPSSTRVRAK